MQSLRLQPLDVSLLKSICGIEWKSFKTIMLLTDLHNSNEIPWLRFQYLLYILDISRQIAGWHGSFRAESFRIESNASRILLSSEIACFCFKWCRNSSCSIGSEEDATNWLSLLFVMIPPKSQLVTWSWWMSFCFISRLVGFILTPEYSIKMFFLKSSYFVDRYQGHKYP